MERALDLESEDYCEVPTLTWDLIDSSVPLHMDKMNRWACMFFKSKNAEEEGFMMFIKTKAIKPWTLDASYKFPVV